MDLELPNDVFSRWPEAICKAQAKFALSRSQPHKPCRQRSWHYQEPCPIKNYLETVSFLTCIAIEQNELTISLFVSMARVLTCLLYNCSIRYIAAISVSFLMLMFAPGSQVIAHPENNVERFEGMDPTMSRPQSAAVGLTSGKLSRCVCAVSIQELMHVCAGLANTRRLKFCKFQMSLSQLKGVQTMVNDVCSASRAWSTGFARRSMSHELERKPAHAEQPAVATLQLSVAAVGMGLRFVELEQTELVSVLSVSTYKRMMQMCFQGCSNACT